MTNQEIINAINGISKFEDIEKEKGCILEKSALFKVFSNRNTLINAYKPYEETLNNIKTTIENECEKSNKIKELLLMDVDLDLKFISECDFIGEVTLDCLIALSFMIEE